MFQFCSLAARDKAWAAAPAPRRIRHGQRASHAIRGGGGGFPHCYIIICLLGIFSLDRIFIRYFSLKISLCMEAGAKKYASYLALGFLAVGQFAIKRI